MEGIRTTPTFRVLAGTAIAASLLLACGGPTEGSSAPGDGSPIGCDDCTTFVGAFFDGARLRRGAVVVGADGRIAELRDEAPGSVVGHRVDLRGQTLLPGLIDLHTHVLASAGIVSTNPIADYEANLKAMLRAGVTSFALLGGLNRPSFELRRRLRAAELLGPRMFTSGIFLEAPGGAHCPWGAQPLGHCIALGTAADARTVVEALLEFEPDLIKITNDSGGPERAAEPMSPEVMAAIVDAAGDVPVIAHTRNIRDIDAALSAGVRNFTHLPYDEVIPDVTAEAWAAAGATFIPTVGISGRELSLVDGSATDLDEPGLVHDVPANVIAEVTAMRDSPATTERLQRVTGVYMRSAADFQALHTAGVPLLAGTDSGVFGMFFGRCMADELARWVELGVSPADALAAATVRAADFLGRDDLGRIAVGAHADFLVVLGDPIVNIAALRDVHSVYRGGGLIDRVALEVDRALPLALQSRPDGAPGDDCLNANECGPSGTCLRTYRCGPTCTDHTGCAPLSFCARDEQDGMGCYASAGCSFETQNCINGSNCIPVANGANMCISAGTSQEADACSPPCAQGLFCDAAVCRVLCSSGADCGQGQSCSSLMADTGIDIGRCL